MLCAVLWVAVALAAGDSHTLSKEVAFSLDDGGVLALRVERAIGQNDSERAVRSRSAEARRPKESVARWRLVFRKNGRTRPVFEYNVREFDLGDEELFEIESQWLKTAHFAEGEKRLAVQWVRRMYPDHHELLVVEVPTIDDAFRCGPAIKVDMRRNATVDEAGCVVLGTQFSVGYNTRILDKTRERLWTRAKNYMPPVVKDFRLENVDGVEYWTMVVRNEGWLPEQYLTLEGKFRARVGQCQWEEVAR